MTDIVSGYVFVATCEVKQCLLACLCLPTIRKLSRFILIRVSHVSCKPTPSPHSASLCLYRTDSRFVTDIKQVTGKTCHVIFLAMSFSPNHPCMFNLCLTSFRVRITNNNKNPFRNQRACKHTMKSWTYMTRQLQR